MTTYYAALKWPTTAGADEVLATLRVDLPILAAMVVDEHGIAADELVAIFDDAAEEAREAEARNRAGA